MSQRLIQTTEQQQVQRQQLSAQQLLQIHLLTMPVAQLEQAVQAELDDNPALETESGNDDFDEGAFEEEKYEEGEFEEGGENDDAAGDLEREDRQEALDNALPERQPSTSPAAKRPSTMCCAHRWENCASAT